MLFTKQPLRNHCIGVEGDRIRYILPPAEAPQDADVVDLPHTTLLPGFVNAHCHMDLSYLRGKITFTGSFADWIRKIVTLRQHLSEDDVRTAAQELLRSGVTEIYDHVGTSSELAHIIDTPFKKRLFLEVMGVTKEAAEENRRRQHSRALILQRKSLSATPSPHAMYSLHRDMLENLIKNATKPLSIHYAESREERETGFLRELGVKIEKTYTMPFPSHFLAVHCNTVTDADIQRLAAAHATVVHCPRSHRFFNHPPFPLEKLRAAGIPIAIGTDSLASCPNFDFLEELRAMREEFSFLTTEEILGMVTGSMCTSGQADDANLPPLSPMGRRFWADIIGLRQQNDLLQGPVTFSMIGGHRVI